MDVYILFDLSLESCGREGGEHFNIVLLSVHSSLESAYDKITNIIGKKLPLLEDNDVGLGSCNVLELGKGWVVKSDDYFDTKYFISKQQINK